MMTVGKMTHGEMAMRHKWDTVNNKVRCSRCGLETTPSRAKRGVGKCPTRIVRWVQSFKPDHRYRFIKDYNYKPPYPLKELECKQGDIAVFKGKSLGYGNFYVKDRNDPEGRWGLIILTPKEAFELLEEEV